MGISPGLRSSMRMLQRRTSPIWRKFLKIRKIRPRIALPDGTDRGRGSQRIFGEPSRNFSGTRTSADNAGYALVFGASRPKFDRPAQIGPSTTRGRLCIVLVAVVSFVSVCLGRCCFQCWVFGAKKTRRRKKRRRGNLSEIYSP